MLQFDRFTDPSTNTTYTQLDIDQFITFEIAHPSNRNRRGKETNLKIIPYESNTTEAMNLVGA